MEGIEILRPRPFAGGTGEHPPSVSRVPVCKILASPSSQPMLHPGSFEIAAVRGAIPILDRRDDDHRGRHAGVAGGAGLFQAVVAIVHFCTCSAARMTWLQPTHSLAGVFFSAFFLSRLGFVGSKGLAVLGPFLSRDTERTMPWRLGCPVHWHTAKTLQARDCRERAAPTREPHAHAARRSQGI